MRKQDRLIALINTLTQGEKKFFAQSNRTTGSSKGYLKLYELLLKKKEYDADELCHLLKKDKAYLANDKKYLEKCLLTSLRLYHEANPQIAILNRLSETALLMERNQPEMASTAIKQCINSATIIENHAFMFHAHGLMLTLCSDPFVSFNETEKPATFHLSKMKEASNKIQLTIDFEILNTKVFTAYDKRKKDITDNHRKETQRLLNNRLLKKDYASNDFMFYKYNLLALLYSRIGNKEANIEVNRKCLLLYEKQTAIDTFGYWNALANLTQSIIAGGNKEMYFDWLKKLDTKYYHRFPVDAAHIDRLLTANKSIFVSGGYYALLGRNEITHEQVRLFTKKFIKKFDHERKLITASHYANAVYKTAACCFIIGDVSDCIDLLNRLFNETDQAASPVAYKNAKLLFIMAHLEWNKFQLIPSLIPSVTNYLKKSGQYGEVEQFLLLQFGAFTKPMTVTGRKLWFSRFNKAVETLFVNPETRAAVELLPYTVWIKRSCHI